MDDHRPRPALRRSAIALLFAAFGLTACATPSSPSAETPTAESAHGIDGGGAAEVAAPARALIVASRDGAATLIDLESDEYTVLSEAEEEVTDVQSDGRLLYLVHGGADPATVEVIDSARWTVPHGDHSHSFRGEPRNLGEIEGQGVPRMTAGERSAVIGFDGEILTVTHDELADGLEGAPRTSLDTEGPVVAFAGHLLVPAADATIQVAEPDGAPVAGSDIPCTDPTDADITRVGAVFACAGGAVLFTREVGGAVVGESIPYPADAAPALQLHGRTDRPDLAGVTHGGAWLLDVRERTWNFLPSASPLVAAAAVGDDESRTIAVDADGRVLVIGADGAILAASEPLLSASLADPTSRERVQVIVDAQHVHVTDPSAGAIHELDHRDGLRLTRTFTDLDPWFVQQVG